MEAVCRHMAVTFAIEAVCLFAFRISGIFSRVVLFAAFLREFSLCMGNGCWLNGT